MRMSGSSTTVKRSLSEIRAMRARGEDQTRPDAPAAESLGEDFWKNARVATPLGKTSVHLHIDTDIVEWFKANSNDHLTHINAVLRAYVETQKKISYWLASAKLTRTPLPPLRGKVARRSRVADECFAFALG
jgi:uncharacterized protein (DUF4415 family)